MTKMTEEQVEASMALDLARIRRERAEADVEDLVTEARNLNLSWAHIGSALRTSGQAAWERYGLSPEERAARSRQSQAALLQNELPGLEVTRADRVNARKVTLKNKRAKTAKE